MQDVTKQQAKERALARKQVAGQGTLDKFLSPQQEKAGRKGTIRTSKKASNEAKDRQDLQAYRQGSHQTLASLKRSREPELTDEPIGAEPKRPNGGLCQADKQHQHDGLTHSKPAQKLSALVYVLSSDDDVDFQPSKALTKKGKRKAGSVRGNAKATKQHSRSAAGQAEAKVRSDAEPAVSFDKFLYSKGSSKHAAMAAVVQDREEVSSVQKRSRTRNSNYTGMY